MDEKYRAKLTASPPSHHRHPTPGPSNPQGANDIHIQPHYPIPVVQGQPQPQPNTNGLIPVHLPSIYVNPFPPQPPAPAPSTSPHAATHQHSTRPSNKTIKIGPWKITKPHPLLWLCLGLSILALVLEVPKGSLPTLTGRHKALRTREKILKDRLNLLTQLSVFLPPPLSHLIAPSANPSAPFASVDDQLHVVPALRFWNTHTGVSGLGHGGESVERWWGVEDLGEGASVVRSKGEGEEKEVWVLGVGENESGDKTLLHALTHSLLMRDRLLSEITRLKSMPSPTCPQNQLIEVSSKKDIQDSFELDELRKEEWDNIESFKRREREREKEVEEREREVGRREKWVVDEMRKLSDKVHSQATELTLEDKITERLKAYQRQLAQVTEHGEV